jgi:hypothetical protein
MFHKEKYTEVQRNYTDEVINMNEQNIIQPLYAQTLLTVSHETFNIRWSDEFDPLLSSCFIDNVVAHKK